MRSCPRARRSGCASASCPRRARRPRRLTGAELDELVLLYQRAATDLSVLRSSAPDPALVGRLSRLVADARSSITGPHGSAWVNARHFVTVRFPAELYRLWRWWVSVGVVFLAVAFALGSGSRRIPTYSTRSRRPRPVTLAGQPRLQELLLRPPGAGLRLPRLDNNAWVAALSLVSASSSAYQRFS